MLVEFVMSSYVMYKWRDFWALGWIWCESEVW